MRPAKLFHTIVIVGASLTACGAPTENADAGSDAGERVADAGGTDMDAAPAVDAGSIADAALDAAMAMEDAGDDAMVLIL